MVKANPSLPELLKAQMIIKKTDQRTLAAKMGVTAATLNHKINKKTDFTLSEIILLMNLLQLSFDGIFIK